MTVVAGYIRMLLKDRAGPLSDQQRRLLEEAEKSSGKLAALLAELSELANLEAGTATFNRGEVDVRAVLRDAAAVLPPLPDREVTVDIATGDGTAAIQGDPARLKTAFAAVIAALRREIVTSDRLLIRECVRPLAERPHAWIAIADPDRMPHVEQASGDTLGVFDEWRGGSGLSLALARRVLTAHAGQIWSPTAEPKAAAVIALPLVG
jgi:signal transduction histidine kinase